MIQDLSLGLGLDSGLTLKRPKQHRAQAPDVPDLAQTVKPWSDLFKIFGRLRVNYKAKVRDFLLFFFYSFLLFFYF